MDTDCTDAVDRKRLGGCRCLEAHLERMQRWRWEVL
jgi:hypothetical protein